MYSDKNIKLINKDNMSEDIELIGAFELDNNRYIIYYKYNDDSIIYMGKIINKDDRQYIINLDSNEEEKIKDIIKKMLDYDKGEDNV